MGGNASVNNVAVIFGKKKTAEERTSKLRNLNPYILGFCFLVYLNAKKFLLVISDPLTEEVRPCVT